MACESSMNDLLERMLVNPKAEPIDLPLSFLKAITNDFSDDQHIGRGGFADVYKGQLQNGTLVAVKKLSGEMVIDEDKFVNEFDCLMKVKHKNIVRFLGYCADTQGKHFKHNGKNFMAEVRQRLLCFEFLPNKSLDKYITDASQGLEWRTRYRIIKGICEGLHYLHQQFILHLDLKPANILLNKDMVPKIADFGLSRCFDENKSHTIAAQAAGTPGYMAPELIWDRRITFKSDIFSLGIIILEVLTGLKRYSAIYDVLQSWSNMFDASPEDIGLEHVIKVCAELVIECIDNDPAKRPTTGGIIHRLDEMERTHGYIETVITSSTTHTDSICPPEIDKLLDVYPLELRFPFEPNKRIQCPLTLTNKTNRYVGVWITPACIDTHFDFCFPDSWDHDYYSDEGGESHDEDKSEEDNESDEEWEEVEYIGEEEQSEVVESPEEGQSPKVPCSNFFQILEPHSTMIVAMTMKERDEPPQEMGKFEVVMVIMWSKLDLKDLESSIQNKTNMDNDFLKKVDELGGKVHPAMITAVVCDPATCQAKVTKQIIDSRFFLLSDHVIYKEFGVPVVIDVHPTNSWILADFVDLVYIRNYRTQETVMEVQLIESYNTRSISALKFIPRKQWFAAADDLGYVHVYDYTTKDRVKKFRAHHHGVTWLAVHATYPFLLSSSDGDQSSIKIWNWDKGWVRTRTFNGHTRAVLRISLNSRDIDCFVSCSGDETVKVWNIHSSNPETTFTLMDAYSLDYVFTDNHRPLQLVTREKAGWACIWDMQTGKRVHRLVMHDTSMDLVACHPKFPLLVTTWKMTLCLWNANTYRLEKMVRLTSSPILDLDFIETNVPRLLIKFENNNKAILETNLPAITTDTDESAEGPREQTENYRGQDRVVDTGFVNPQCVSGVILVFNEKSDKTPTESTSETPISSYPIGDFNSSIKAIKEEVLRDTLSKARLTENAIFNQIITDTSCTDPFNGLYVGEYGSHGQEVVQLSRKFGKWSGTDGEQSFEYVEAIKLTGDVNVPAGQTTFRAKIGNKNRLENHGTYPEEFGVIESYKGQGRIADTGFVNPQWVDGELLVFSGKSKLGFVWGFPKPIFMVLYFCLTQLTLQSDETPPKCVENSS